MEYARLADVPDGGFLVAEEVNMEGGRKYIHADTPGRFFESRGPGGRFHEVLRYPARLVVDIDDCSAIIETMLMDYVASGLESMGVSGWARCRRVVVMHNSENPMRMHATIHLEHLDGREVMLGSYIAARQLAQAIPGADMGIYRRNASLRLPFSPKYGRTDVYQIPACATIWDCIAWSDEVPNGPPLIGELMREGDVALRPWTSLASRPFEQWVEGKVAGVEAQQVGPAKWNLRRHSSGSCPMCRRDHDSIDLVVERSKDGKVWLKCPRYAAENAGSGRPRAYLLGFYRER